VSKRITELEEGIGSSPLLRLPRGVTPTPTPAGRSLLRHLRVLLDATAGDVA
jgi:DNA-binding transcriptional LysR family regulator